MRILYSLLTYLLRPLAAAVVLWRGVRNRQYWEGLPERFGLGPRLAAPSLWVHAVSLGEVTAAAPLVRALRSRYPNSPLIVTTATLTGRARARELFGDTVAVRFLPYDTPGSMRRFLSRVRPRLAVIMETELWPNLFRECRRHAVPLLLANARLSMRSVTTYRRLGSLFRDVFQGHMIVAAQSAEDAERFIAIGAVPERVHVVGNLKFDVSVDAAVVLRGRGLRQSLGESRSIWIAGSTHAGEEEAALAAHTRVRAGGADALLLLVPRHPQRFAAVADLLTARGVRFARRSEQSVTADTEVLLVDTVGELASLYAAVDVAFVGGSLVPVGGHNLLEPAALGVPVVTGPYQSNAREVADLLIREGAVIQVDDAATLASVVTGLLGDPDERRRVGASGRRVVEANRGSLERLLALIEALLETGSEAAPSAAN
jgi:3-deoxy-D-manno-octulosonic-acid transferase